MKSNRSTLARLLIGGLLLWSMLWIMRSYVQTNSGSREGTHRVSAWMFVFGLAVYNLVRMRNLVSQAI